MISKQYLKFLINGGLLGLLACLIQFIIFKCIEKDSSFAYAISSLITYLPLLIINFILQKKWVFARDGIFWRFVLANILIMLMVSLLSPLCRYIIYLNSESSIADALGFAMAAILCSVPSFLIKRRYVFIN